MFDSGKMGSMELIQGLAPFGPLFQAFIAFAGFIGVMGVVFGFVLKIIQRLIEKDITELKVGQKDLEAGQKELKELLFKNIKQND